MLACINKRLYVVAPEKEPAIVIYGSCPARINDICARLRGLCPNVLPVYNDCKIAGIITAEKPALVIIGGRCKPEVRLMVRYLAAVANPSVIFSEPGIGYINTVEDIINDVLAKLPCKYHGRFVYTSSLTKAFGQ